MNGWMKGWMWEKGSQDPALPLPCSAWLCVPARPPHEPVVSNCSLLVSPASPAAVKASLGPCPSPGGRCPCLLAAPPAGDGWARLKM